jgi:uracil-DNA glycosylase
VTGESGRLAELHGQKRPRGEAEMLLTYHPTAAMRFPRVERRFRRDLRLAGRV